MNYKTIEERLRAYPHKIKAHQNAYPNQRIVENKSPSKQLHGCNLSCTHHVQSDSFSIALDNIISGFSLNEVFP